MAIFARTRALERADQQRRQELQDFIGLNRFITGGAGQQQNVAQNEQIRQLGLQGLLPPGFAPQFNQPNIAPFTPQTVPGAQALTGFNQQQILQGQKFGQAQTLEQIKQFGAASRVQPKTAVSVIIDPEDPNRAIRVRDTFDATGNRINREVIGEATLAERIGGVSEAGLQRGTKTKLEKDITDLTITLGELDVISQEFSDEFFTVKGRADAFFSGKALELGIPVPEARKQFLAKKTKFFADAKRVFLVFRKFITGVAGGIEEFKEIAKASIDPEKGSGIEFRSKMQSMKDNAIRTRNVLLAMRNSGLDPASPGDRRTAFKGRALSSIPLDVSQNVTLDTLGGVSTPKTQAEFDVIPAGTEFIDTDGKRKVKR